MKKIFIFSSFFFSLSLIAGWVPINIGINDNFNSIWASTGNWAPINRAVIFGDKGIYATTTGGLAPADWNQLYLLGNAADSAILSHSKIYRYTSNAANLYFCGEDTVEHKAVIFHLNGNDFSISRLYTGSPNTKLNDIDYNPNNLYLYAVGSNGLFIYGSASGSSFTSIPLTTGNNLVSINVNSSNSYAIGGENVVVYGNFPSGVYVPTTNYYYPQNLETFTDVLSSGSSLSLFGTEHTNYSTSGNSLTLVDNYDFGPLNANEVKGDISHSYIATDHGIYFENEFQTTSAGYFVNDLSFSDANNGFAVGPNGLVLVTTNAGAPNKPVVKLNIQPYCSGYNTCVCPSTPMRSTYLNEIYINGAFVYSGYGNYYYNNFPSAGTYTVTYILSNSSLSDTAEQIINIYDPPADLSVEAPDSILCKNESAIVQIHNSNSEIIYELRKQGGSNPFFGQASGNGDTAIINSNLISNSGYYFIKAYYINSTRCFRELTDKIYITVEKTKADFHAGYINAVPNESFPYYEKCMEAQHFDWRFPTDANLLQSNLANPTGISYSTTGLKNVTLICWSDNLCFDTITKAETMIYSQPTPADSIWNCGFNKMNDSSSILIHKTHVLKNDDYLISGSFENATFNSVYGKSKSILNRKGNFLAKYNKHGVLKWILYTGSSDNNSSGIPTPFSLNNGEIYFAVDFPSLSSNYNSFTFNNGDSLIIPVYSSFPYPSVVYNVHSLSAIMKLDTLGNPINHYIFEGRDLRLDQLFVDEQDNLFIKAKHTGEFYSFYNGILTEIAHRIPINNTDSEVTFLKLNQNILNWKITANFSISNSNPSADFLDFVIDNNKNMYISGQNNVHSAVISFPNSFTLNLPHINNVTSFTNPNSFIVKTDSNGVFNWKVTSFTKTWGGPVYLYPHIDSENNLYLTNNLSLNSPDSIIIIDANNTRSAMLANSCNQVLKFGNNGLIKWIATINQNQNVGNYLLMDSKDNEIVVTQETQGGGPLILTDAMNNSYSLTGNNEKTYIAHFDTSGTFLLASNAGTNYPVIPSEIHFDNSGGLYLNISADYSFENETFFFSDTLSTDIGNEQFILKPGSLTNEAIQIVSLNENVKSKNYVNLFPNPSNGEFSLEFDKPCDFNLLITDITGIELFKKEYANTEKLHINSKETPLKPGTYLISVESKEFKHLKKLILIEN